MSPNLSPNLSPKCHPPALYIVRAFFEPQDMRLFLLVVNMARKSTGRVEKILEELRALNAMLQRGESRPKQPRWCVGCVWGTWTGTVQFCPLQTCVRE